MSADAGRKPLGVKNKVYFNMETLPIAFPHIAEKIFRYLDHQDLENCYFVCQSWQNILEYVRFIWNGSTKGHPGWIEAFYALSFETLKQLHYKTFMDLKRAVISKNLRLTVKIHPIFCAIYSDDLEMFKTLTKVFPNFQEMSMKYGIRYELKQCDK